MPWRSMEIIKFWWNNGIELLKETLFFFISPKLSSNFLFLPIIIAFLLGGIGYFFNPPYKTSVLRLLWIAFIEELTWRVLIQEQLNTLLGNKKFYYFSLSCILTSVVFALFHCFQQSLGMAALIFFPAMVFGILWDLYKNPYICIAVHFWYNFTFFYIY